MKQPKSPNTRPRMTDEDRNKCLRLIGCGLSTYEIADIMQISKSTVSCIRQAHNACLAQDWSTLQKLSIDCKGICEWAMKVTGVDKVFEEFQKEPEQPEPEVEAPKTEPVPYIHPGNLYEMYEVLTDIRSLLTEIRDILK